VEGSTLELTILKAGTYPTDEVDLGEHVFSCALLPHAGTLYEADVIKEAYSFNQPLEVLPVAPTKGVLSDSFSLVSCSNDNIILETIKKAEADEGMILRLYDSFGCHTCAHLTVADGFREVWLCDMMESPLQQLPFDGHTLRLPVNNFEILTLKFIR
jgi:alpha-mannosidase